MWPWRAKPSPAPLPRAPERLRGPQGEVHVLATLHGLVSEAARVKKALVTVAPQAVALALSPEGTQMLLEYEGAPGDEDFDELPEHDLAYSLSLARYGQVALPPPDLLAAAREAQARGIPLRGVDLAEDDYEEAFTKQVSTLGFLRYGRIQRRLASRPPRAPDAQTFVLKWDAHMRRVKGLAAVERLREQTIARNVAALAAEEGRVLLVIDLARREGVLAALEEAGLTRT